jgi:hypothetical protein
MQPSQLESPPYSPPAAKLGVLPPARRWRLWSRIAFALITLAVVALAVHWSLDPNRYFSYAHQDRSEWRYQVGPVIIICSFIAAEGVLAAYALTATRPQSLWVRCLMTLVPLGLLSALGVMMVMHAPSHYHLHAIWALALTLIVACAFVAAVVAALVRYLRAPAAPSGAEHAQ